jgi:hypothetical protein
MATAKTSKRCKPPPRSQAGRPDLRAERRPERRPAAPAVDTRGLFAALKDLLVKHARHLVIVHDAPDQYYLNTRKPAPDGKPMFFGEVRMNRNNVAYHLMPLSVDPALAAMVSPALRKRMQGKSGFIFTEPDPVALEELDRLTRAGMASLQRKGLA